jgi:hypothetical protein
MSNNLTPQYLSNLIPQNFCMIHDNNNRHTSRIPPVRTRTSLYASFCIAYATYRVKFVPVEYQYNNKWV